MCQILSFWKHKRSVRYFNHKFSTYPVISAAILEPILLSSNWAMRRLWKATWCHPKTMFFSLYWKHKRRVHDINKKLQTHTVTSVAKIGLKHLSSDCGIRHLLNSLLLSHNQIPQTLLFVDINLIPCCVIFPLLLMVVHPPLVSKNMMKKERIA